MPASGAAAGCSFRNVYPVAVTLVTGLAMLNALFRPNPATIHWFIDTAFVVMMIEAVVLVPLATFGSALRGKHRLAQRISIGVGVAAAVLCLAFGGAWFSVMVGLHIHGRIAGLPDEPDHEKHMTGGLEELVGIAKNRWMVQFILFIAAGVAGNAAWEIRSWLPWEVRAVLRIAGGTQHSLVDVIMLLWPMGLYFVLSAVNDAVRLPCVFRSRDVAEPVPVRAIVARVEREHAAREEAAQFAAKAADEARAEGSRAGAALAAALESPDGAQALLLALAGRSAGPEIAGLPLSRRLLMADAALAALRPLSAAAKEDLLQQVTTAIAADARMTPAEFALLVLARSRLAGAPRPAGPATIRQRAAECDLVLALVARAGEGDTARAMASGRGAMGLSDAPEPPLPDSRGLSEALRRLRDLDAPARLRVLRAITGAVFPMNDARVALLYAFSVALEVPLPAEAKVG